MTMRDLPHIAARLYGAPLMIARPRLEAILSAVGPRLAGLADLPAVAPPAPPAPAVLDSGVAVLPIVGTLTHRSGYLDAACGLTSYAEIVDRADALFADARVRAVVMEIDSAGGEAAGVFAASARLRELAQGTGKPLWAVAEESALSAAYCLATAASTIYVSDTGEVGSIGVVAAHVDQSARDAQEGLRYTFIYAGSRKIDGTPHAPLSDDARAAIAADLDAIYARFVDVVAARRGLRPADVVAQQAAVYRGEAGVRAGLADRVGGLRQAIADLESALSSTPVAARRPITGGPSMQTPELATSSADAQPVRIDAEAAAEIVEIAEQARALGVSIDAAAAIREGIAPDALRRRALAEAAGRDAAADIVVAATPADADRAASTLIAAARTLAEKGV